MNKIKEDQEKRIAGLQKEQEHSEFKALLLLKYINEVHAIITILQIMKNSGIPWKEIHRQIKEERKANNPLAELIFKMDLEKNQVAIILDAVCDDKDEEEKFLIEDRYLDNCDPVMKIDIDITLSAQLNIRKYFEIKKQSHVKEEKTKVAADVAV